MAINPINSSSNDIEEIVSQYFYHGYKYSEILKFLHCFHNTTISTRKLHRILRRRNLYRKRNNSESNLVINFVETEIQGSASSVGYRQIHQTCLKNKLKTTRAKIAIILRNLDPVGVERRRRHCLRKRLYFSKGPNWVWHIDGYDKLKPYGFPIHGCIDGFSRRILWLRCLPSNKDPRAVCRLYADYIEKLGWIPRTIVADRGTENVMVSAMQRFLRRYHQDSHAGDKSVRYVRSVVNQRIESFWSQLRKSCSDWWISFFQKMILDEKYDPSNVIQRQCLLFSYMGLIQKELNAFQQAWNSHSIRPHQFTDPLTRPAGRPDVLYFTPDLNVPVVDYKLPFCNTDYQIASNECCKPAIEPYGCSEDFAIFALQKMRDSALTIPGNALEAMALYGVLVDHFETL